MENRDTGADVPEVQLPDAFLLETILKELSDIVRSIDDVQDVMNHVVRLTTRLLKVGKCSLVMIEPDGATLRIRAAHGLPEEVMRVYRGRMGEGIGGYVAQTGKPLLIEDVETHPLFARKSKQKYTTKSLLSVPLIFHEKVIGVLNVNNRNDGGIFTHSDELILSVLANFVVIAIHKAQMQERVRETERYEADLRIAREIQMSMLPASLPQLTQWRLAARNLPAREVAGDFYDAIPLPDDRLCLVLGDVCGKGVPAAVYMARVLGYFRVAARTYHTAVKIMSFVNDLLAPEWTDRTFVTAAVCVLDDRTGLASFCSAGHQQPVYLKGDGAIHSLPEYTGLPLGVQEGVEFDSARIETQPADTFLLYTDGVTEAQNGKGELLGTQRLHRILTEHPGPAEQLADSLLAETTRFAQGAPQSDDITFIVIQRAGTES